MARDESFLPFHVGWYDDIYLCIQNSSDENFNKYFSDNPITYYFENDYRWDYPVVSTIDMLEILETYTDA